MADIQPCNNTPATSNEANPNLDVVKQREEEQEVNLFYYPKRAQWLRAAVLGAMMGVGAVQKDFKTMMLIGVTGLVAGACSMAIGEFVSIYSQYDIELAQMKREGKVTNKNKLPNPFHAALASALAFAMGAMVPLLGAAFIKDYKVRSVVVVVVGVVSLALLVFGGLGVVLGKALMVKSSLRVLIGGWVAIGVSFGLTKVVGHVGL